MSKRQSSYPLRHPADLLSGGVRYGQGVEGAAISTPVAQTSRCAAHASAERCKTEVVMEEK